MSGSGAAPWSEGVSAGRKIDYRRELNEPQFEAVTSPPGDALVLAGAGSGKTRTLIYRVAWLLESGVPPHALLLLTFTNKAARQMLDRVHDLLGLNTRDLWGGTFHSICARILRMYGSRGGIDSSFAIMDREDQEQMLRPLISELPQAKEAAAQAKLGRGKGARSGFPKPEVVAGVLSFAENTRRPLEDVLEKEYPQLLPLLPSFQEIRIRYQDRKRETNSMDFDDLMLRCLDFLRETPDVADALRRRFEHVLVDEFQDTNRLQSELIQEITGGRVHLMVVGDDAQGIYSWRGADHRNILDFQSEYPAASKHTIEINYRSVPEVLALANDIISRNTTNFPKHLSAARPTQGKLPELHTLRRTADEARFVASRICGLIESGVDPAEIAVLYRAHYLSMDTQLELTARNVPFRITSGLRFFEQAHIKDVASFLKLAANPKDELSFRRMIKGLEGVGAVTAGNMWEAWSGLVADSAQWPPPAFSLISEKIPCPAKAKAAWMQIGYTMDEFVDGSGLAQPADMIRSVVEGVYEERMKYEFTNFEARRQDIEQLTQFSRRFESIEEFLADLSLLSGVDTDPRHDEKPTSQVVLSSIHQAKGLEWEHVFLIGLADGAFPSRRVIEGGNDESLEEERRLFYVAVTRARDRLTLTYPEMTTTSWSGDTWNPISRFLSEIRPGLTVEMRHR